MTTRSLRQSDDKTLTFPKVKICSQSIHSRNKMALFYPRINFKNLMALYGTFYNISGISAQEYLHLYRSNRSVSVFFIWIPYILYVGNTCNWKEVGNRPRMDVFKYHWSQQNVWNHTTNLCKTSLKHYYSNFMQRKLRGNPKSAFYHLLKSKLQTIPDYSSLPLE